MDYERNDKPVYGGIIDLKLNLNLIFMWLLIIIIIIIVIRIIIKYREKIKNI
jgi:hypothetical protein